MQELSINSANGTNMHMVHAQRHEAFSTKYHTWKVFLAITKNDDVPIDMIKIILVYGIHFSSD